MYVDTLCKQISVCRRKDSGGGVDNWTWYGEGYQEFMKEEALGYVSEEEMPEDPDAEYVAKLMLKDFEEI